MLVFPRVPSIADVAVVNGEHHHPLVIVEDSADMHFFGAFTAKTVCNSDADRLDYNIGSKI